MAVGGEGARGEALHVGSLGGGAVVQGPPTRSHASLNSVSGLVSKIRHRIPFDQSEPSILRIPPTDSQKVRLGRDP